MNYVILNGVKSNTINGLMIQSLSSISKPLMRTEIEEIDGRDGDIVTKLGYSAYNKEMTIGLYGNYNIDDVISYFDSEGTVTFSNEIDKYYKYQIVDQIDFDRLIRFRTAKVTFHVQPFKYSAVDNSFSFVNQLFNISDYSTSKNGVNISVKNGVVSVNGTANQATEIYIPLKKTTLGVGTYTLSAAVSGTTSNACSIRVIKSAPSDADSFGGNYLPLMQNDTVTMTDTMQKETTFGYLWVYMNKNLPMNFTLNVSIRNNAFNSVSIRNIGNIVSRPKLTLYGSGEVNLSINGFQVFSFKLSGYITIDSEKMNAYQGDRLMNRSVTGDYDKLVLNVGTNNISWSGNVTEIDIENFSRWL